MTARQTPVLIWGLVVLMTAITARADEPTVRDLVRKHVKQQESSKTNSADQSLPGDIRKVIALEYTVLLLKGDEEQAVDPHAYGFQLGDRIRVQVQPLTDLHIYIFHEGASGERDCLLPAEAETPPLAKREQLLKLPNDGGYFEFKPPAGDERLIVVATETPVEVKVLSTLVFKEPGEKLSPEEEAIQQKLKGRVHKTLKSIREQVSHGTKFRGMFTDELLSEVGEELKSDGNTRAVLEEPPHGKQKSTFTMSVSPDKEGAGELFVSIPLKSTASGKR
ncbi:MAG TPA: DUF4384 domain-containing protein [Pirellulales bacterium]|nr:DUF4384 domain-containing protein [Pirellulales bacterium]